MTHERGSTGQASQQTGRFAIFSKADAPSYAEAGAMTREGSTAMVDGGIDRMREEGSDDGHLVKLLFAVPGLSLSYAWFKSGFPLPRHSHNVDCFYYIVGGSLRLGTETLGDGDGFFVPAGTPYTYVAGPAGLEILEFRNADRFAIKYLAKGQASWSKAAEIVRDNRERWLEELPPHARSEAAGVADRR